jgi:hypothetical protein
MGHFLLSTNQGTFSRWGVAKQQISQIAAKKVKAENPSFFSNLKRICRFVREMEPAKPAVRSIPAAISLLTIRQRGSGPAA